MDPRRIALIVVAVYLIPSAIYIYVSSTLAGDVAGAADAAVNIEIIKGLAFVTVSALVMGGVVWWLLSRLRSQRRHTRRLREELLEAQGRHCTNLLAASLAHDARNELTVLRSNNDVLRRRDDIDDWFHEIFDDQKVAIETLMKLIERLADAVDHRDLTSTSTVDLAELTESTIDSLRSHSQLVDCQIELTAEPENIELTGSPTLIRQALVNLLLNAGQAVDGSGRIQVQISGRDDATVVEVHDDGPGIPPERRDQVFEPFYTTRPEGTGLGMLSVETGVRAHGGDIAIDSSPLGGTRVALTLPSEPVDNRIQLSAGFEPAAA